MATNTNNYNLIKPEANEYYDVNINNSNLDIIDAEIKGLDDEIDNLRTSEGVFNRLTDNGKKKAIVMEDGELYISPSYVKEGLLDGCMIRTTKGGTGKHIHMEEGSYTAYDGSNPKGYLGFRNPMESNKASDIAFIALGHDGVGGTSPYIAIQDYPSVYNPIGLSMAYSELAYQFYAGKYSSLRFLGNGSIELNAEDYVSVGTYKSGKREELLHIKIENGKGCIGSNKFEAETLSTVNTFTDNVQSNKSLLLQANESKAGVVLYDSSGTKCFEPMDGQGGKIYCGSSWAPWKGVYSQSQYSSDGVFINEVSEASNNHITLDNVIDNINFVSSAKAEDSLQMDVTNIIDTEFVNVDKFGNVSKNDSGLIKLLILEVQKLKLKVKELEGLK